MVQLRWLFRFGQPRLVQMRVVDFGVLLLSCCDLEGMDGWIQVERNDEFFLSSWLLHKSER